MNSKVEISDFQQLDKEMAAILPDLTDKHIVIAGATGMLAMYMAKFLCYINTVHNLHLNLYLLARNEEKVKMVYGELLNQCNCHVLIQDVCDPVHLDVNIDYIVHAAGAADPKSIVSNPVGIWNANIIGTMNLCNLAREKNSELLFLSTREIYGNVNEATLELQEDSYGGMDPLHSRSCYPISKLSAEAILTAYQEQYQMKYKIVRIAHSYGPGMAIDNDGRIMADMMHNFVHAQDFVLKSDGQMKRSFCYIADCVKALLYVMLKGVQGEAYNVANESEEIRVVDLAQMMADIVKTSVVFEQASDQDKKGYLQTPRVTLCTKKLEALGWQASVSLRDGIERTRQSFKR